ncbi:MAG: YqjD family protein [Massilia sp.]
MDNQKSNDGNARNVGSEGSGSSMGRDLNTSSSRDTGISKNLGASIDQGTADLHKTIDKAAGAAQPTADRLASSAHAGVDKVSGALSEVSSQVGQKSKQLGEAYNKFAETGRGYVRSSPATSVLVALGAGYMLSKLLNRRT